MTKLPLSSEESDKRRSFDPELDGDDPEDDQFTDILDDGSEEEINER